MVSLLLCTNIYEEGQHFDGTRAMHLPNINAKPLGWPFSTGRPEAELLTM
jgi:hypothetical protein